MATENPRSGRQPSHARWLPASFATAAAPGDFGNHQDPIAFLGLDQPRIQNSLPSWLMRVQWGQEMLAFSLEFRLSHLVPRVEALYNSARDSYAVDFALTRLRRLS